MHWTCSWNPPIPQYTAHTAKVELHKENASSYTWSLYCKSSTATDRQWAMSHSNAPPVRKRAPLTARSISFRCVWQPSTRLQNSTPTLAGKKTKACPKEWSIMEYSPGLPQDAKSLRSCSWNRAKMLLKCHLGMSSLVTVDINNERLEKKWWKTLRLLSHRLGQLRMDISMPLLYCGLGQGWIYRCHYCTAEIWAVSLSGGVQRTMHRAMKHMHPLL